MLSRGYLEPWANDRGVLYVYDKELETGGVRTIRNATVVGDAYATKVVNHDLEGEFADIESAGLPSIRRLLNGATLSGGQELAIVRFLDMFIERGNFADQFKVRAPIAVASIDQPTVVEHVGIGDRLSLARSLNQESRTLLELGIRHWKWKVLELDSEVVTGDGSVITWNQTEGSPIEAVTFPISPYKILQIGRDLARGPLPLSQLIAARSRRWVIGTVQQDTPGHRR